MDPGGIPHGVSPLMGVSPLPEAVGLQLLLNGPPGVSLLVARAACTAVGIAYPIYSSFKSIEAREPNFDRLKYWSVFGVTSFLESFLDTGLRAVPYYYHAKLLFLLWLQAPKCQGASRLFDQFIRPFLLKHQQHVEAFLQRLRQLGAAPEVLALVSLWRHAVAYVPGLQRAIYAPGQGPRED